MKTLALSALQNILTLLANPKLGSDAAVNFATAADRVAGVYRSLPESLTTDEVPGDPVAVTAPAAAVEKPKGPGRPPKVNPPAAAPAAPAAAPIAAVAALVDEVQETQEEEVDLMGDAAPEVTAHDLKAFLGAGILRAEAEKQPKTVFAGPAAKIMKDIGGGATNVATIKPEFYSAVYDALKKMEYVPTAEGIAAYSAELKAKGQ